MLIESLIYNKTWVIQFAYLFQCTIITCSIFTNDWDVTDVSVYCVHSMPIFCKWIT